MEEKYILSVDQSTQGTKGLLFDSRGRLAARADLPHRQIVNEKGWVEHDPAELLSNTLKVCRIVTEKARILPGQVVAMGISNQRETSVAWDRETGMPVCNAIVWQCARAADLAKTHEKERESIRKKTGIPLSPYFPASKFSWIMKEVSEAAKLAKKGRLCLGTVDSWLLFCLTKEKVHKTDYSNASRTQLFHLKELCWDRELCHSFQIPPEALPEVCMSDSCFGHTDLDGYLPAPIPICGVLGDSHGALFGQDCRRPGQIKATYGTGSSVMMNIGEQALWNENGLVTSIAWGMQGRIQYVFEGNLNYTGAVISWLKDGLGLIGNAGETAQLSAEANPSDRTYFVPAFTGLGAPYWDADATGLFTGISRTTGKKEIVKACLECIAYQIADLTALMEDGIGRKLTELKVDGGPTENAYLMQFQSDIADLRIRIPQTKELSGMGAAYAAGLSAGLYQEEELFGGLVYEDYLPHMEADTRERLVSGWKQAVRQTLAHD